MASETVTIRVPSETRDTINKLATEQGKTAGEVAAQFMNASVGSIGPLARNSGREQGTVFLSNTGAMFASPAVTPDKIREALQNVYIRSQLAKRSLVFFPEEIKIEVFDPREKIDSKLTQRFQNMLNVADVRLNEKVKAADGDALAWGKAFFNPIWSRSNKNQEISLTKLRYLSAEGFDRAPIGSMKTWSPLLQGVIINDDTGQIEYHRRLDDVTWETEQITNLITVSDPQDAGLAGDSKLIPLLQIIEMLKYCWNTEMQAVHRAGAPIFFLKITNAQAASADRGLSDVDYGKVVIKNWSKNKQYILRENMEIIGLPLEKAKDVLNTVDVLELVIEDYFSITKVMSSGDSNSLNDSSVSKFKLLNQAAHGLHNWLLAPFETLLNQYFYLNGYPEGWAVSLSIPLIDEDRTKEKQAAATIGIQGKCVDLDDLRDLLDLEPADEEKIASIDAFWKAQQPAPPVPQIPEVVPPGDEESAFEQKAHVHMDEDDPIANEMAKNMDKEIDALSAEILKTLEAAA